MVLAIVMVVLAAGCVADRLMEHIPAVERFIRSLPLAENERPARR